METKAIIEKLQENKLFTGIYDAENGNDSFMYGILTVLEAVAELQSEEYANEVQMKFFKNMSDSEERVS